MHQNAHSLGGIAFFFMAWIIYEMGREDITGKQEDHVSRIHTDLNGVAVNAFRKTADGEDVSGHRYQITAGKSTTYIDFQKGPVKEAGVNGLTSESLLAVLIDRTKVLDSRFPCEENALAIAYMEAALAAFESRTKKRLERGVEGLNIA